MPADVIINPTTGEIYWNDGGGTTQSISIRGDSQNKIDITGYSSGFSPGSSGVGTFVIATFNDNSGTSAFTPGTSGFDLGSSVLRWNSFITNANLSGTLIVSDSTLSSSLLTGSVKFNGGIAISGNASIGQSLNLYGAGTAYTSYTGFKAGSVTSNTIYTLPLTYPSTGTSVLQSDTSGVMSWVPMSASSSSSGGTVSSGTQYQIAGYYSGTGASVAGSSTFTNNTASGQVQILHTTVSSGTSSGALQVAGGVGISGRLTFNQASFGTTGIASLPTMAMIGQTGDPIYLSILEDNSISFEGSQGQLFSISPNLSTGFIWSVNDISGIPLLRASSGGTVYISEFGGLLGIGQTNPTYKLDVKGNFGLASSNDGLYSFIFSNSAASGSNTLQIRSANAIRFYNSANSFYTGIKSNAAGDVTYTLPTTDGSPDQFLKTNGSGILSWATPTGGSGGGGTGVGPGAQYEIAVYPSTGSSVVGYSSLKNNFDTGVVSITHSTASTNYTNGALTVSGGVGIGGSLNVGGIGASIVGINISNSTITRGTWNGTVVSTTYGGTGQNLGSSTGVLTISSGTVSASTTSAAILSLISDETGGGVLVFNTQPSFGTGVTTGDSTFAVFNTNATTINAFGAANIVNIATSTATGSTVTLFGSNTANYLLMNTGAGGVLRIQTDSTTSRVRLFENMSTSNGTVSFFGTSGGTLYLGTDNGTSNGDITIRGNFTSGGGGNQRAAIFTIATATSNGTGVGGTIQFQTSTSSTTGSVSNALRTRMRIEGAATGTSNFESEIIFGDDVSGTAFTSTLRGSNSSGTNINAGELIIQAARSTGTGTMAGICFNVASPGISGSALNPVIDVGHLYSVQNSTSTTTGSFVVKGGVGITGNAFIGSTVTIQSTAASPNTSSGALVVSGGVGIGNSVSIAGRLQLFNGSNYAAFVYSGNGNTVYILPSSSPAVGTSVLQSASDGTLSWVPMTAGGGSGSVNAGTATFAAFYASSSNAISENANLQFTGTGLSVGGNIQSSSTSTGSLQVRGGIAITGNAFIGGTINVSSTSTSTISGISLANGIVTSGTWSGSTITAFYGGTGLQGPSAIGDIIVANTATTWSRYATSASAGQVLTSNGTGNAPTWQAVPPAAASSVAVAPTAVNGSFFITIVNTSNGSGLGLSTVTSFVINPNTGVLSLSGLAVTNLTNSSSTLTGALTVAGGLGITGNAFIGGTASITSNQVSTSSATGALVVTGGAGIGGSLYVASPSRFDSSTVSTSVGTGALVVAGGVGIGGSIYVASPSSISGVILNTNYLSATGGTFTSAVFAATIRPLSGNTISFQQTDSTNSAQFNSTRFAVLYSTAATSDGTGGLVVSGGAGIAGSLFTGVGFSSSISGVVLANSTVSAGTYNKVTITAPTNGATLTLANSSSLITSGGNSLTFTTTATSSVTLPTAGTLTTTGNKLSVFAATTSSELLGVISDETGSGALVFNTQPSFGTGVTTGDSTFAVFNTNASTINAFGAATVMSIGANTGKATFNSTDNSISATTGALVVSGGAGIAKSITVGGRLQMLNGANYTAFVSSATSDVIYTLPPAAPSGVGSSYLSASTTGVMAWVSAPTSGGSATPGGSNKQIQYNSSSTFGGASGFEYTTAGNAVTVSVFSPSGTGYTAGLWVSAINGATTRVGIGLSNPAYELEILGEISATNKSFVIDHPTKRGMKLRYGSLEGPENGVYVRGELKGTNIIEVPDHWVGLVHEDSYTVHLTPIGRFAQLYVEKIENYNVYVADNMMCPIHCYYSVWAERKDIPKLVTEYEAQ